MPSSARGDSNSTLARPVASVEADLDSVGHFILLFAPYAIVLIALAYNASHCQRARGVPYPDPVLLGVVTVILAVVWCGFRSTEAESKAPWQPVTMVSYLACWLTFVIELLRTLDRKKLFFLASLLSSGILSLLGTALWSFPRLQAKHEDVWALYWRRNVDVGPLVLVVTSIVLYFVFCYEQNKVRDGSGRNGQPGLEGGGHELDDLHGSHTPDGTSTTSPDERTDDRTYLEWLWNQSRLQPWRTY